MTTRETKTPAIPDIRDDNVIAVLKAIKNTLEVREGRSGDPLDQNATLRDLSELGLVDPDGTTDGVLGGSGLPVGPITPGGGSGSYNPETDLTTPPAPTNLEVVGGFAAMYLSWDGAPYQNHAYTEVWRSSEDNLGEEGPNKPFRVGTSVGNLFADPVEPQSTYYYWVRFVSRANVIGPWNSTSGTSATSSFRVDSVLPAISEAFQQGPLFQAMSERVRQIEVDSYVANRSVNSQLLTLTAGQRQNTSRIIELHNVTESAATYIRSLTTTGASGNKVFFSAAAPDTATPGSVGGVALNVGDVWYDTDDSNRSYRYVGGTGLNRWVEFVTTVKVYYQNENPALTAGGGNNGAGGVWQDSVNRPFVTGDLWYDANDNNKPYRWNGATNVFVLIADTSSIANITTFEQTKVGYATLNVTSQWGPAGSVFDGGGLIWNNVAVGDPAYNNSAQKWNSLHNDVPDLSTPPPGIPLGGDSEVTWHVGLPFAQATKNVGVSVDGGTTWYTVQQQFTAMQVTDNGLLLQYTIKLDSAGYISGFGLANTTPLVGPTTSKFIVNADAFGIAPAFPAAFWANGTPYNKFDLVKMTGGSPVTTHVFQALVAHTASGAINAPAWGDTNAFWADLNARLPFIAQTTYTTVGGKTYPPGVWMPTVFIADATIDTAHIISLTADKITTGTLTATISVTTGKIHGGTTTPSGTGYFLGLDASVHKFYVGRPQDYMLWNGTSLHVQGHIVGKSGSIGGINMSYGTVDDPTTGRLYSNGVTGFTTGIGFWLDYTGRLRVGNPAANYMKWDGSALSIKGTLDAVSGTFHDLLLAGTNPYLSNGVTWTPDSGSTLVSGSGFLLGYASNLGEPHFFVGSAGGGPSVDKFIAYVDHTLVVIGDIVATGNIIAENVTLTRSCYVAPSLQGTNSEVLVMEYYFTLYATAAVILNFTARHHCPSGGAPHEYRMTMNGTQFFGDGELAANSDYVAMGYAWDGATATKLSGSSGGTTHVLRVYWRGKTGNVWLMRALAALSIAYR